MFRATHAGLKTAQFVRSKAAPPPLVGMKHHLALPASRLNTQLDREQGLAGPVRDKPGNQGVM